MNVREAMTPEVRLVRPEQTIREAARLMSELDIGALPVHEDDRLIGMLTDRDIAVRAVADGLDPDTPIRDVMSAEVMYCFEDQPIDEVAENMSEQRLRRLPVLNRGKRLVGILSLADIAIDEESEDEAWEALSGISRPGGEHSQTMQHH
jgi:CBS domain-containing protein